MNDHIIEYLNYYINIDNPQYAVLLIGNWGCGKTYFIKEIVKTWKEPEELNDKVSIRPIYVSLNGIADTHSINERIRAEISPFLYSKGMKVAKNVFKGLLKTTAKIDFNFNEDDKADGNISFNIDSLGIFDSSNKDVNGRRIIIFDDIERCKIKTDEIFGYINNFVEHSQCKVILLTDEEKIKKKYEKYKSESDIDYKDFKEKLVGQTFEVKSDIDNAVTHFISGSNKISNNLSINTHEEMVKELFISSQLENLRVLKQALLDFNRLSSFIDKEFFDHVNFQEFIKNLLAYFIIVYAEYKTGNDKIHEYQSFNYFDKKEDSPSKVAERKYNSILEKFKCYHSTNVFPLSKIVSYIEKGFISKSELNKEIKTNAFFRVEEEQDWEKLWWWRTIDDKKFVELRNRVWNQFSKGEIGNIYVTLHIAGIFFTLIDEGLIRKNKKLVLTKSKQIIKRLYQKTSNIADNNLVHGYFDSHSWGKEYQGKEKNEFIELKDFLNNQKDSYHYRISRDYTIKLFDELNQENVNLIYSKLNEVVPSRYGRYEDIAIFKHVDGNKLGRKIKSFNSKAIYDFKYFIHSRYYPEEKYTNVTLKEYHVDDLNCLKNLNNELKNKMKVREQIKNRALKELILELDNIEKRIEKIK